MFLVYRSFLVLNVWTYWGLRTADLLVWLGSSAVPFSILSILPFFDQNSWKVHSNSGASDRPDCSILHRNHSGSSTGHGRTTSAVDGGAWRDPSRRRTQQLHRGREEGGAHVIDAAPQWHSATNRHHRCLCRQYRVLHAAFLLLYLRLRVHQQGAADGAHEGARGRHHQHHPQQGATGAAADWNSSNTWSLTSDPAALYIHEIKLFSSLFLTWVVNILNFQGETQVSLAVPQTVSRSKDRRSHWNWI